MNPLDVLRDSLYFFKRNLGQIVQLCLPLVMLRGAAATSGRPLHRAGQFPRHQRDRRLAGVSAVHRRADPVSRRPQPRRVAAQPRPAGEVRRPVATLRPADRAQYRADSAGPVAVFPAGYLPDGDPGVWRIPAGVARPGAAGGHEGKPAHDPRAFLAHPAVHSVCDGAVVAAQRRDAGGVPRTSEPGGLRADRQRPQLPAAVYQRGAVPTVHADQPVA